MQVFTPYLAFLATIFVAVAIFWSIGYMGGRLAKTYPSDIRVVFYFWSLSMVATILAAVWGTDVGAISPDGNFKGSYGDAINAVLKFMLNLKGDLQIFSAIVAVTVLPQAMSYLLSGLFGCATAPILVADSIQFFVWSTVKSFVVAAGIVMAIAWYGVFMKWKGWDWHGFGSLSSMSVLLVLLAFGILYLYRDVHTELGKTAPQKRPAVIVSGAIKLHGWFTRNIREDEKGGRGERSGTLTQTSFVSFKAGGRQPRPNR